MIGPPQICYNFFLFWSWEFIFSDITDLILKHTNLGSITLYFCHRGYPTTHPIIREMFVRIQPKETQSCSGDFKCYSDWTNVSLIVRWWGTPMDNKYRVIDTRFVRFRIRSAISENMNSEILKTKKS